MEIAYHYVVGCEMKFVFASDSFKGSLLSKRISQLLTMAAREVLGDCDCIPVTMNRVLLLWIMIRA